MTYGEVSLPPGGTASYSRCLLAQTGSPCDVRRAALEKVLDHSAEFRVRVGKGERAVEDAWVRLFLDGGLPTGLLRTGPGGRASCRLPPASYRADLLARGRSRLPSRVPVKVGKTGDVTVTFPARSLPQASVKLPSDAGAVRLLYAAGRPGIPFEAPRAPFFSPVRVPGAMLTAGDLQKIYLPESGFSRGVGGAVIASRGPLHRCKVLSRRRLRGSEKPCSVGLKRAIDPGDYAAVDFGQSGPASPRCSLTRSQRIRSNRCEGLHGALVTLPRGIQPRRHSTEDGDFPLLEAMRFGPEGSGRFTALPVRDPYSGIWEHFPPESPAGEVPPRLRDRAVVQFAPSPLEERSNAVPEGVDALQLLTGGDVPQARKRMQMWFRLLNEGRRIFITGASGSRGPFRTPAGLARTYIYCPTDKTYPSPEKLRGAIADLRESPHAFVSNGPFIRARVNGQPIGSQQTVQKKLTVDVTVSAPRWVDLSTVSIYRNGSRVHRSDVSGATDVKRLDREIELEPAGDCWIAVTAGGDVGMRPVYPGSGEHAVLPFAATNPFWVDGDGDGAVTLETGE